MKTIFIILIAVGGIILIGALIKIITKNRGESSNGSDSGGSLMERAKGGIGKLADCCKKLVGK